MITKKWHRYPAYKDSGVEWLGEIPEHWEVKRLKYISRLVYGDSLSGDTREDGNIPVYGSNGVVGTHIVPNTFAPCIIVGRKGSYGKITYSESCAFAIDTTYFIDIRTVTSNISLRWLFYVLSLLELDKSSQDTGVPGLSREFAHNQLLPLPRFIQQQKIAEFLDRETAKIDTLIAKKTRLIELLKEKRTALISHAVTKGLNPDVPMKDSGVEWLGEVPEHWKLRHLRRIVNNFVDYRGATPEKVSDGIPLITTRNIKNATIDFSLSQEFIKEKDYDSWMVRGFPEKGDVVVTTCGGDKEG